MTAERSRPLTRLVRLPEDDTLGATARLAGQHIARGRSVLVVSALHPAAYLFEQMAQRGVPTRRLFVVDTLGAEPDAHRVDPEHMHRISSPTLLELLAARVERIIKLKAEGDPTILVLTVDAFAQYNDASVLEQLGRYVLTAVAKPRAEIDFLVETPTRTPARFVEFLRQTVDSEADAPAGVATR